LRAIIASARLEDLRWPNISDQRAHLEAFYRPSGYKLVWLRDGTPTAQAAELIQILQNADEEGLRAEDYDGSRWPQRLTMLQAAHTETDEANFDAALTVCIMRYLSDLHIGRINPRHLDFDFDVAHKKLDLPQFVRQGLVNGSDLHAELATVGPPFAGYQRLRIAFQHYVELAKRDDGAELPYPGVVSAGNKYVGLERLTSLLRLLGDLPESASIPPDSKVYEGALVDAVKHFQERYGLPATGELNYPTIREMNVPLSDRLEQMRLGLERYRWIPYKFSQPPIAVNVPEFRLYGFNEKNQLGLSMKVNVGEAYEFQTPIFEKDIQYIVFRPYWNPPPKILRNEIIPELQGHPDLQEANLEIVTGGGQVIKTGRVSDALVQQVRSGKASVRQPPGPENSLGLVKFIFPNEHHVYLHDTPESVDMFSGKERALSHGCIHVQDPAKLAEWLLRNTPGWDLSRVEQAMHDGRNDLRVNLAAPIPLLIVYDTAVVEENGDVHFFHDIYGHDATLKEALAEGYPYPR
jgi:murein L,D-transpeptidase YcbB/YkuD